MSDVRTMPTGQRVSVFPTPGAWTEGVADRFMETVSALPKGSRVVLAGGSTPFTVYERVVAKGRGRPWNDHWYLTSDERCVPPDHPDSNFGRMSRMFLKPLGISDDHVVRFHGEKPPERAAEVMHRELLDLGQRVPLFDLALLGLGEDGHTASLFPAETWPDFGVHYAAAVRHPDGSNRLTLTPLALRAAERTWFLVSGAAKKNAVLRSLQADGASSLVPATLVTGKETDWFLDQEAASGLSQ
jgi:6-phosphogluconolactonase